MVQLPRAFLSDESGSMSLDWVVLTAMLVGTSVAVLGTVSDGVETLTMVGPHVQLREDVVSTSFDRRLCPGGVDALQLQEDARAETLSRAPLDVDGYMQATYGDKSAAEIREEYRRAQDAVQGTDGWTIEHTILGAVECELVLRGLD
jgi:hypothetical protein